MKVFPDCEIKMLSECSPGQLIRTLYFGQEGDFSIVCKPPHEGKVGVVWVDGDMAIFDMYDDADMKMVLAYKGDLVWEVDQTGPFEPPNNKIFDMPGCFVIANDSSYLNVIRPDVIPKTKLQLNINDGSIGPYNERPRSSAIFCAWKLFLEDYDRPTENRVEIATFCVKAGD